MNDRTKTIIIADDSEAFVMYLGVLMRRLGFKVIPAESGLEVLKLMKIVTPALAILDITMPIMDGITALEKIKTNSETTFVPVIMVTGREDKGLAKTCRDRGAIACLPKPVNVLDLCNKVFDAVTWPTGQQRRHLRAPYGDKIALTPSGDPSPSDYYAVSLSEGGVYLRTHRPLPIGAEVEMNLPLGEFGMLAISGTVIYTKDVFGDLASVDPGMAVQFTKIPPDNGQLLKSFILQVLVGDLVEEQTETVIKVGIPEIT